MILSPQLHGLLTEWLDNRPIYFPERFSKPLPAEFVPQHLDCYGTARTIHANFGYPVIAGIRFLDKAGKLFPWPHMVNALGPRIADGLVDASPIPDQTDLGFIPIKVTETSAWNEITAAYHTATPAAATGSSWGCQYADDLSHRYLAILYSQAECRNWDTETVAVPASIPKVS